MIELQNVWKAYGAGHKRVSIVANANLVLPPRRKIALLGSRGCGKTSLIRLLSRIEAPDRGVVRASGLQCWPLDNINFIEKNSTVQQTAHMLGHTFGRDGEEIADIASDLSGVALVKGKSFRSYETLERKMLALGMTLSLQFEWYFVDVDLPAIVAERPAVFEDVIVDRLSRAGVVWATNDASRLESYCDAGLVLHRGKLRFYDTVQDASEAHMEAVRKEGSKRL